MIEFHFKRLFNILNIKLIRSKKNPQVNISSAAGLRSTGTGSVYAMTKAAMVQLTKNLACPGTKTWRTLRIYGQLLVLLIF